MLFLASDADLRVKFTRSMHVYLNMSRLFFPTKGAWGIYDTVLFEITVLGNCHLDDSSFFRFQIVWRKYAVTLFSFSEQEYICSLANVYYFAGASFQRTSERIKKRTRAYHITAYAQIGSCFTMAGWQASYLALWHVNRKKEQKWLASMKTAFLIFRCELKKAFLLPVPWVYLTISGRSQTDPL